MIILLTLLNKSKYQETKRYLNIKIRKNLINLNIFTLKTAALFFQGGNPTESKPTWRTIWIFGVYAPVSFVQGERRRILTQHLATVGAMFVLILKGSK